ncbi:hypothetical protein Sste5344_005448 [Sporothrix stenoceras]
MEPAEQTPSLPTRRRKFRIKSKFGEPRQWRSRKKSDRDGGYDGDDTGPAFATPGPLSVPLPLQLPFPLPSPISVLVDAAMSRADADGTSPCFVEDHIETAPPITVISQLSAIAPLTSATPCARAQSSPGRFSATADRTAIYTLDDNEGLTAHSMGLSGEQDTELLASFRAAVMNEADSVDIDILQVYAGGDVDRDGESHPPVHFNMVRDEFLPLDNAAKQASSDRIETAVQGCADGLIRLYFKHVHPVFPVLSKTRFLKAYADNRQSIPASLRGAVYGIASNFWHRDPNHSQEQSQTCGRSASPKLCGASISHLDQHELFEQALASLQRELHGPNLWTLQACLLLIHENSAENATVETPRVWMLAAQAVACAQLLGLHRDPMAWQIEAWEMHLRRKLWWATFSTDVWSSVCHGNPPHIYPGSFTTSPLSMEDMAHDENVPASLRHMVDEDCVSSDTAVCARFTNAVSISRIVHELLLSSFLDIAYLESIKDQLSREVPLLQIRRQLQDWSMLLPRCISMESIPTANVYHSNDQVRDTFALLGKFHDSLQRLSAIADEFAIGVLRPVALRIDSFFTQAAQVMRTNGQSPSS